MTNLKLASAGDNVKIWDCQKFALFQQFNPHKSRVVDMCWTQDSQVFNLIVTRNKQ